MRSCRTNAALSRSLLARERGVAGQVGVGASLLTRRACGPHDCLSRDGSLPAGRDASGGSVRVAGTRHVGRLMRLFHDTIEALATAQRARTNETRIFVA
jgi:hypothetical protein